MSGHDLARLACHSFGVLAPDEAADVDRHVLTCADCRRELEEFGDLRDLLSRVPAEALLDGPAEDGELLLSRIAHAAATPLPAPARPEGLPSRRPVRRSRGFLLTAAAVVLLGGTFGAGVLTGRHTGGTADTAPDQPSAGTEPGARTISMRDPQTGVGMSMDLVPAVGWVSLSGHFTGVTPGSACEIYVVARSGDRILAGGWLAPADADRAVVTVEGSAIVAPADITSVEVDTTQGKRLVVAHT
jgi:hypothetical protein